MKTSFHSDGFVRSQIQIRACLFFGGMILRHAVAFLNVFDTFGPDSARPITKDFITDLLLTCLM